MLKNSDLPICDLKGVPVTIPETNEVLTFDSAAINALLHCQEGNPSGAEKAKRFKLATRLAKGGEIEFTVEELTLVKLVVGAMFLSLVVGRFFDWADDSPAS